MTSGCVPSYCVPWQADTSLLVEDEDEDTVVHATAAEDKARLDP